MPNPHTDATMQQVLIRMPVEMYEAVKQMANNDDRTIAAEVRRALRNHLNEREARAS